MRDYHDKEWGVPVHHDRLLFEMLILEGAQAGLTWATVLRRRKGYKKAFDNFDVKRISKYTNKDIQRLMKNTEIIRNKLKIISALNNAKAFMKVQEEFGSFEKYLWNFIHHQPIINKFKELRQLPASTALSERISKDLRHQGFTFVGPTIIYAFMQAVGMANDHETSCFRYKEINRNLKRGMKNETNHD